ncbi:MAG: DUF3500 domain-containing protein [Betaproteobacteria bacterium]|nr:DUF3500 domain-containing protein [Betaproteobacteria bacterium]
MAPLLAVVLLAALPARAHEGPHPSAPAAAKMRAAATRLVASLPEPQRGKAMRAFGDADRTDWHYTPRSRGGVSLKELDATGREAVHALLREALSAAGYRRVTNILELELVLREVETFGLLRDPEKYHLTLYGVPDAKARWGWRFEGHHLSLHFTLAGDRLVADTPSFFGANPATVASGPRKGLRTLGVEEDEARALLALLTEAQSREAIFDERPYGDIVTANADKVDPLKPVGIAAASLDARQRAQLWRIVEAYASAFEPGLAQARLARAKDGGLESIRFGWAGSTGQGPHYYRIQGPRFLIEYDASPGGGNHVHTVWRDFTGDFGRDLLREHYALSHAGTGRR